MAARRSCLASVCSTGAGTASGSSRKVTEITHRAKLHGKTQAVVLTTLLRNQCVVAVIEMEVTSEVLG